MVYLTKRKQLVYMMISYFYLICFTFSTSYSVLLFHLVYVFQFLRLFYSLFFLKPLSSVVEKLVCVCVCVYVCVCVHACVCVHVCVYADTHIHIYMYACMHAKSLQSCPTLCDSMDSSHQSHLSTEFSIIYVFESL